MNLLQNIASNLIPGGNILNILSGESKRKKERARSAQREAGRRRAAAAQKARSAQANIDRLLSKARAADSRQDRAISSAHALANRSLSTAKSAVFQSSQLRNLVAGIRKDLKTLAASSASSEALSKTNEQVAELVTELKEMAEADKEHKEATDAAIEALNKEAADTTAHLDALTESKANGEWQRLATDVLPWARIALSALNLERPTNELAYYGYLAAGPFLRERMDPAVAELLTTALQIAAYWDEEGLTGLLKTRAAVPPQYKMPTEVKAFLADPAVLEALEAADLKPPRM